MNIKLVSNDLFSGQWINHLPNMCYWFASLLFLSFWWPPLPSRSSMKHISSQSKQFVVKAHHRGLQPLQAFVFICVLLVLIQNEVLCKKCFITHTKAEKQVSFLVNSAQRNLVLPVFLFQAQLFKLWTESEIFK